MKLFILLIFSLILPAISQAEDSYKFGVFPYLSPIRMSETYAPANRRLTKALNTRVLFKTSSSFKKFLKQTEERGL